MPDSLTPLTVVTGTEELLIERAVRAMVSSIGGREEVEVEQLEAVGLDSGKLTISTSPSLFGGPPVVVIRGIERLVQSDPDLEVPLAEVLGYLSRPSLDACVVLVHGGGNGGKAVLAAAKKAGAVVEATPSPKKSGEVRDHRRLFVKEELRAAKREISPQAVDKLIDAVGTNLREVAAACAQLASDSQHEGESQRRIDESDIMRYYGGRAEVKTFDVADRVVAGHIAEALGLFRHARDSRVPVLLFPAALARTLRQLAIVASAPRAATVDQLTAASGVPYWKVKEVRESARHWTEAGLVRAIRAVAEADAAVKGEAADADYALERMLITVGRSRGRG